METASASPTRPQAVEGPSPGMVRVQGQILLPLLPNTSRSCPAPKPAPSGARGSLPLSKALISHKLPRCPGTPTSRTEPASFTLPAPRPRGPPHLSEAGGPHCSPSQWQQAATSRPALGQAAPGKPLCCVADPMRGCCICTHLVHPLLEHGVASHWTYGWWATWNERPGAEPTLEAAFLRGPALDSPGISASRQSRPGSLREK